MSVYFIQSGAGGPIKVGSAIDIVGRLRNLQNGNPEELTVLCSLPGARREEFALHETLMYHHIRGEWFKPSPELLLAVRMIEQGSAFAEVLEFLNDCRTCIATSHKLDGLSREISGLRRNSRDGEMSPDIQRRCFRLLAGTRRRQAQMIYVRRHANRRINAQSLRLREDIITIIAEGEGQVRG